MSTNFAFEPEMVEALAAAFRKSWSFISSDPQFSGENPALLQRQLAGYLMQLAENGEHDPLRLANSAIYRIRHEYSAKLLVL